MGKFMIIFPHQITAEQMGFSFEFLLARIIFALGRTFQNLEKTLKICLPSTPIVENVCISSTQTFSTIIFCL